MLQKENWVMIKNLHQQGLSKSEIGRRLSINRKTVANYIKQDTFKKYKRKQSSSKLDKFKPYINARLEQFNLSGYKLFEEIQKQGFYGKYGIVANYVKKIKKSLHNKAYLRFETIPGQQAQVDWGYYKSLYDHNLRKLIKIYFLVITLGYSRTTYVEFFKNQKIASFLKGHNNAFKYFGGYTKDILYDNLKSVVIKRALTTKDSTFNQQFLDFAGYYGFNPILARPYKPETKGKVESKVNYVKNNFLAGETFHSLEEINLQSKAWLEKINNKANYTTREIPFNRLTKENLISIENKTLFNLEESFYRKVQKDCHFSFEGNFYSVPYKFANKEIAIKKINDKSIVIFYRAKEIASHNLSKYEKGKFITLSEHIADLKKINFQFQKTTKFKKYSPLIDADNNIVENRDLIIYERGV